ncbi:MAG TPA: hypothetical protein VHA12_03340 [Candidatus Nanoarchaeia archaeon]|nr:hypothetical protein [Candidatus Nanoarchaeia archaeon]
MNLRHIPIFNLVPTQRTVKLSKLIEKAAMFNPKYFCPLTANQDGSHTMLVEGHHRATLFYIAQQAFNHDFKLPVKFHRKTKNTPSLFEYGNRTGESVANLILESYPDMEIPLSELFTRDQDVYAKIAGSSQYLFTLPDKELFQETSERYNLST